MKSEHASDSSSPSDHLDTTGWMQSTVADSCKLVKRGSAPIYTEDGSGVLVLNQKCIRNQRVDFELARRTDAAKRQIHEDRYLQDLDVLVNSTGVGTLGRIAQVDRIREPVTVDSHVTVLRPDPRLVDPKYFGFAMRGMQTVIESLGEGSTGQTELSRDRVGSVRLCIPPAPEQNRIARVLAALDNKIENNRRLAQTLEAIVAAVFKARFVDFVGYDDLVESEIGLIPRGWDVVELKKIATSRRELINGDSTLPYIGLGDMPPGSTVLAEWIEHDGPTGQSVRFRNGDILFGKLRPYFRKVGVAPIDGRCSTEILVLEPSADVYRAFLFGHVSSQSFVDHCVAVSRGTRMPRSEWKDAATYRVAIPPTARLDDFNSVFAGAYGRVKGLTHESRTLAAIRDTLLPQLISGKLRVPEDAFEDADAA